MITTENTVKTSTRRKGQAYKNIIGFAYNYPESVLPFEVLENKIYEECKGMETIECFRIFGRVLSELRITLGSDYNK